MIAEKSCNEVSIDQDKLKFETNTADNLTELQTELNTQISSEKERESKNIEKFQCTICPYVPSSKSLYDLNRHIKVHQGEEREKFVCPDCGKILLQKESFKKHIDSKHNGKKYPCNICDFQAKSKDSRLYHINKVHKKKKYMCHICEYVASCNGNLTQHKE